MNCPCTLIAGIGNIFLGDDAFGVEVAQRLAERSLPDGVRVVDFGIRGFDLAYALLNDIDRAILVDALPRGGAPGTLYVIEPDLQTLDSAAILQPHGMDPVRVLGLARTLGGALPPIRVVGCEPATLGSEEEPAMGLSDVVLAAVPEAIRLVEALAVADWTDRALDNPVPLSGAQTSS
jgi:hydrogenase maturation protease